MRSKSTIKRGLDILIELEKLICFSETVGKTLNKKDLYWQINKARRLIQLFKNKNE